MAIAAITIDKSDPKRQPEVVSPERREATHRLIEVLHQLDEMADANIDRSREIKTRIRRLVQGLEAGAELPEILAAEGPPYLPGLISANIEALHDEGAALRKAEAAALRAYGYTMEEIAALFGVSRQRISALLRTVEPPSPRE